MNNSERIQQIRQCLEQTLHPTRLEIIDESSLHAGHEGAKTGKGHFAITIAAPLFKNKTLLEKHRLIYKALQDLMEHEIHALRIQCVNA